MSIYIGQTNYGFPKSFGDRLVINPPINQDDINAIRIGTDIQLGSENNRFLVFDKDDNKILDIGNDLIVIDQPITFHGMTNFSNIRIYDNYINENSIHFQSPLFDVNSAFTIDSSKHIHVHESSSLICQTHEVYFEKGIRVNEILPITDESNVVIKNLILDDMEIEDAIFKNNILIDHAKLPDKSVKTDVVSLKINKNSNNTNDFIQLLDDNTPIFNITKHGSIGILHNNNSASPPPTLSLGVKDGSVENILEAYNHNQSNVFTIGTIGNMTVGKSHVDTDTPTSMLSLHRRDLPDNILSDPVCLISMDYHPDLNKITSRQSNVQIGMTEFYPFFDKNNDVIDMSGEGYRITLSWLPFTMDNIDFRLRQTSQFGNPISIGIQSRYTVLHNHYNYNNLYTTNSVLIQENSSNMRIYTEAHTNPTYNDGNLQQIAINIDNYENGISGNIQNISYIQYTCNIELNRTPDGTLDNPQDDITLNIKLYWIYSNEIIDTSINVEYINTEPLLVEPPPFIDCVYNGNSHATIDALGHITAKSMDIEGTLNVSNLDLVSVSSPSFTINNMTGSTLFIYDKIDVGNGTVTISAEDGIQFSQGVDIRNNFTTISFSNINSTHLKYSPLKTEILNTLHIGLPITPQEPLLHTTTTNIPTTNIPSVYVNGYMSFVGTGLNHNTGNTGDTNDPLLTFESAGVSMNHCRISYDVNKDNSLGIADGFLVTEGVSVTTNHNDNDIPFAMFLNVSDENRDMHQHLTFAEDHFVSISVSDGYKNNRMCVGIPYDLISTLNEQNTPDDWYRLFRDYTNKDRIVQNNWLLQSIRDELTQNKDVEYNDFSGNNDGWKNIIKQHYNHSFNTFGNIRFASPSSKTLVEVREKGEYETTHNLPTLNVFGNMRCRSHNTNISVYKGDNNSALEVVGTSLFHDKVFTINGVASLSDKRVKEDLQCIKDPLDKIKQLCGYTYNRTDITNKDRRLRESGLIAQDVEKILPEVITEGSHGMKHIAYGNMMGLMVEAIKSLDSRLECLEKKLEEYDVTH